MTKLQLPNLHQTIVNTYLSINFKISTNHQHLNFMTKPQLPNLQQTVANTILIINISNSNNLNKF